MSTTTKEAPNARSVRPVTEILIESITMDKERERLRKDEDLAELVASMRANGLLQPIGVVRSGDPRNGLYRLVYGHRRVEAARKLGWVSIMAVVLSGDGAVMSEDEVLEARAIENLQRRDLNPAEEAVMVAQLLESLADEANALNVRAGSPNKHLGSVPPEVLLLDQAVKATAIRLASSKLAKSETWVRDRAFLGRLGDTERELVLTGRLPLAHAREIAKLADPTLRKSIALEASAMRKPAYGPVRELPLPLSEVKRIVAKHIFSLAQVPWKLEIPFADAPACDVCLHNSANQAGLFESGVMFSGNLQDARSYHATPSGKTEPKAGTCTMPDCYRNKSATANRRIAGVGGKVARLTVNAPKKERKPLTPATVAEHVPEFLQASQVVAYAKDKLKDLEGGSTSSASSTRKAPVQTPEQVARGEHRDAMIKYGDTVWKKILKKAEDTPGGVGALLLLTESDRVRQALYGHAKKARDFWTGHEFKKLCEAAQRCDLGLLAKAVPASRVNDVVSDDMYEFADAMPALAKAFGVADAVPQLDEFVKQAKEGKLAAKALAEANRDEGDDE